MVHGRALKLAVACAVIMSAVSVVGSAVVIAGASGPGTTYSACLKAGKLTKVGTTSPTCKAGSTVISWNSQGPAGPPGTNGTDGAPGPTGSQGPAGPGAVYLADNSNGTLSGSVDTPDLLAADVNGFSVHLSCQANEEFDTADVQATLAADDTSAQSVNSYTSSLTPSSGGPSSGTQTGAQLHDPAEFAIIDNIVPGAPATLDSQGYVVANSGGLVSQPEAGFWFFLHLTFQLSSQGAAGNCSVTGMLVPVSGNRTVPLPIILPPPVL